MTTNNKPRRRIRTPRGQLHHMLHCIFVVVSMPYLHFPETPLTDKDRKRFTKLAEYHEARANAYT